MREPTVPNHYNPGKGEADGILPSHKHTPDHQTVGCKPTAHHRGVDEGADGTQSLQPTNTLHQTTRQKPQRAGRKGQNEAPQAWKRKGPETNCYDTDMATAEARRARGQRRHTLREKGGVDDSFLVLPSRGAAETRPKNKPQQAPRETVYLAGARGQ